MKSRNVFTLLISVLLSAQCTDVNVNNVTEKDTLKKIQSDITKDKDTETDTDSAEIKTTTTESDTNVDLSKALESVKPAEFTQFIPKSFKDATVQPIKLNEPFGFIANQLFFCTLNIKLFFDPISLV